MPMLLGVVRPLGGCSPAVQQMQSCHSALQSGSGPGLSAQLASAQALALNVQSTDPEPKAAEIPEGKYLGNRLQTTMAVRWQQKASSRAWEYPVHSSWARAAAPAMASPGATELALLGECSSLCWGGLGAAQLFLWVLDCWAHWCCPDNKPWQQQTRLAGTLGSLLYLEGPYCLQGGWAGCPLLRSCEQQRPC